jgi:hypothetical protein
VRWRADAATSLVNSRIMAKPQLSPAEDTLETLLDKVCNAREQLLAVERSLERLRAEITKTVKPMADPAKAR